MTEVFLSVGSNIEPARHIAMGVAFLRERYSNLKLSPIYECPPVGFTGALFHNLVLSFVTEQSAFDVQQTLREIEQRCGRRRQGSQWQARSLDLDLILYGDLILDTEELSLPRADILRYAFVLRPLADLAPQRRHPRLGQTYAELWQAFPNPGEQPLWLLQPQPEL